MLRKILVVSYLLVLILTRFWNVGNTARFTRDESYDIVKLHQYWKEKKITLVGAIDYTGQLVYSSLTYYTMMPFAVLGNFEPVSSVYTFSVVGTITIVFLYLLIRLFDRKRLWLFMILALVWFPLVQASRWSWNPHFLPYSMSIAIYLYFTVMKKRTIKISKYRIIILILSGIFFGAAFHYHYISVVSTASFLVFYGFYDYFKYKSIKTLWTLLGFFVMLTPYIIFDLRHPPGLFFTGYLKSNMVSQDFGQEVGRLLTTLPANIFKTGIFLAGNKIFSGILTFLSILIAINDFQKRKVLPFIFLIPALLQIVVISFLPTYGTRYFLPALILFFLWLTLKRGETQKAIICFLVGLMIVGNLLILPKTLTQKSYPSPKVVEEISNQIVARIKNDGLQNNNIGVLASPDPDPLGAVYRDVLLAKEIQLLPESEFRLTDNLFIITTSDEVVVRNDLSNIMNGFRDGAVREVYDIADSNWKVLLFNRD